MIFLYAIGAYALISLVVGIKEEDAVVGLLWPILLLLYLIHLAGFRIH